MPLWYHPPPVLVEEGASTGPGCPVNPPLYYHPPPVCIDPSENVVIPPNGSTIPSGGVVPPCASANPGNFSPQGPSSQTGVASGSGLPPPMIQGVYPVPYQAGVPSYLQGGHGGFHAAGGLNFGTAQPANIGIPPASYSIHPPQNAHAAPFSFPTGLGPKPCHGGFPEPPRFGASGTAAPPRLSERVYYYDNEAKEVHVAGPDTPAKRCAQHEQSDLPLQQNLPTNPAHQDRSYYANENSGHNIIIAPNSPSVQHHSRHLELTRDSGEFEVKLWRGGTNHRCEKKVRVVSGPSKGDSVGINLSECQICDNHEYERDLDEVERQRLHELVLKAGGEELVKQLGEDKLKGKIREEAYARMKADEKLKLEVRKELEREDAQLQEMARVEKLLAEKRATGVEAGRRAVAELEREHIRKEVDIELKRRNEAYLNELEAEKERQFQAKYMVWEGTRQHELAAEVEKRRKEQLASIDEEKAKRLGDRAKQGVRQQEIFQAEQERIRREVDAELERREQAHLAKVEAERLKEDARNLEFVMEKEKRRITDLGKLATGDKRGVEEQKVAGEEVHQHKFDQERHQRIDGINRKRAEEDRIRGEEWEKVRAKEIQCMREEIRKELSEGEAQRIKDKRIRSETLRLHQLEADRIRSDEQARIRIQAGRGNLRRELLKELEKEEEDRMLRLHAEAASLRTKAEAEALTKESRIRSLAEARERQRIEDQILYEEATRKQQSEQAEAAIRERVQAQTIALEQEALKKKSEGEVVRPPAIATAVIGESEMRRIIRAEIKEDMRKSRVQDELKMAEDLRLTSRSPPHRERVQLHWETDYGGGFR